MGRKKKYFTENERIEANRANKKNYREKNSERIREWKIQDRRKKQEWFRQYKSDKVCIDCGNGDWRVLDFHHRDPFTKIAQVSRLVHTSSSMKRILAEIEKCDIVCANCHRIRHTLY